MPELTQVCLDKGLRAVFGGPLTMALTRGQKEITDAGYSAQPVTVTEPMTLPATRTRFVTNTDRVQFGPWVNEAPGPVEGWEIRDASGMAIATGPWFNRDSIQQGNIPEIDARSMILAMS